MKKKKEESIEDLRAKVAEAIDGKKFKKASDLALHLAIKLRNLGRKEEAIKVFKTVDNLYEQSHAKTHRILALKAIAELSADLGEREEFRSHLDRYEAEKRNTTDYQLMLSTGAYCMLKLYTHDKEYGQLLSQAREYAEKSLLIITTENLNTTEMLHGDSVKIRKIFCHRIMSEIRGYENKEDEAEYHSKEAFILAKGMKAHEVYEIVRTRNEFVWRDKVETSLELCNLANSMTIEKKIDARVCLSEAYFEREEIEKGIETLFSVAESHVTMYVVGAEVRENYYQALIFGYKARERLKRLQKYKMRNDRENQYYQAEALADLYSTSEFNDAALKYYRMSLGLATTDQRVNALSSCAETCAELKKFKEAAEYFRQLLEKIDRKDILETSRVQASVFKMRLLGGMLKYREMKLEIERMEKKGNMFLNCVYWEAAVFCAKKGRKEEAECYRKKREKEYDHKKHDYRTQRTRKDDIDELKDEEILNIMKEEKLSMTTQVWKVNQWGETKLIKHVRAGKVEEVEKLIDKGANVNECDTAGLSALSKAVVANQLDMVKLLVSKGANPKSQSKEGWKKSRFDGKITPLMEACFMGFHGIARYLLNNDATLVTATNLNGYSPADFLYMHIKTVCRGGWSETEFRQHLDDCEDVFASITHMQRTQGFPVRDGNPPGFHESMFTQSGGVEEKRRVERRQRKREAAEMLKLQIMRESIGSRSKQAEKENLEKLKEREEEDRFDEIDDDFLVDNSPANKRHRGDEPNDSEEEMEDEDEIAMDYGGRRRLDSNDSIVGLEEDGDSDSGDDDIIDGTSTSQMLGSIDGSAKYKRRRNDSESSQRQTKSVELERHDSIGSIRQKSNKDASPTASHRAKSRADRRSIETPLNEQSNNGGAASPVDTQCTESRPSLSSSSAIALSFVQVIVVREGMEPGKPIISKAPCDTEIADLPLHIERLRSAVEGEECDWICQGSIIGTEEKMTLGDLEMMYKLSRVELRCRVKRTL